MAQTEREREKERKKERGREIEIERGLHMQQFTEGKASHVPP